MKVVQKQLKHANNHNKQHKQNSRGGESNFLYAFVILVLSLSILHNNHNITLNLISTYNYYSNRNENILPRI